MTSALMNGARKRALLKLKKSRRTEMYPPDWPRCPVCDEYALDGHITCGKAECNEAEQRVRWQHGMMTKQEEECALNSLPPTSSSTNSPKSAVVPQDPMP